MAEDKERSGSPTGLDDLREELGGFLADMAQHLVERAGDKVSGLTDRLNEAAQGEGGLLGAGGRMLQGQSPVRALVGQKATDLKDKVVGSVKDTVGGGGGGGGGKGGSAVKAVNIMETIDVGVPLRMAYNQWTQFEDFSAFTKGVRSVSQSDEVESDWNVKVGPSSRGWKATVQEQIPDERIVWTSEGAKGSTHGAVSFHELGPTLTRILVVVEYYPAGFFEKTGNLWRAQGRRLRLDLKHFGRHVTLNADEEVEGWRGEIRDGEVVRSHEEGLEADEAEENEENGEDGGGEDAEAYDEDAEGYDEDEDLEDGEDAEEFDEDDEDDNDADDNDADEEEDEDEAEEDEEERPRRRRSRR